MIDKIRFKNYFTEEDIIALPNKNIAVIIFARHEIRFTFLRLMSRKQYHCHSLALANVHSDTANAAP